MATIGISEFAFGYAFLYEQTRNNWGNLQAAPILPSLQKEKDEGWDARLPLTGTDFFYQFKLSDHLSRGNAAYIADGTYTESRFIVVTTTCNIAGYVSLRRLSRTCTTWLRSSTRSTTTTAPSSLVRSPNPQG